MKRVFRDQTIFPRNGLATEVHLQELTGLVHDPSNLLARRWSPTADARCACFTAIFTFVASSFTG